MDHVRNADRLGGPERLLLEQCARASGDVRPRVISFGRAGRAHAFLDAAGTRGIEAWRVDQVTSYDPRAFRRVRKAWRQDPPDVLVGHDYKADLMLAVAGRGLGIPRVAVAHGYTGENWKVRFFERWDRRLMRGMDAVVVVSAPLEERLVASGVDAARINRIPNAIDVEGTAARAQEGRTRVRDEWGFDPDDRVIVCLGRLSPEKGQDVLLEAFLEWQGAPGAEPAHLVFVGDGPLESSLRVLDASVGTGGARVHFAGWRRDPHACLGAADAFVLPSRTEGLPLALLEAMAAERPVLATRVGDVAEVLREGTCGLLVDPGDGDALRAALPRLFGPDADARRDAATMRVADAYGAARQVAALEALYRSLGNRTG